MHTQSGLILTALLFSICPLTMAGEETVISFDKVPEEILNKAKKLLPEAQFKTANIETEDDGTQTYEIQSALLIAF